MKDIILSTAGEVTVTATDTGGTVLTSGIILRWRPDAGNDSVPDAKLYFRDYDEMMLFIRAHPEGIALSPESLDDASEMSNLQRLAVRNPDKDVAELEKMLAEIEKDSEQATKVLRQRQAKENADEGRGYNP